MDLISEPNMPSAPGTVRLTTVRSSTVVLSPKPSSDRNDPLNWSALRKGVNFSLALFYVLLTFVLIDIQFVAYSQYVDDLSMTERVYTIALALNFGGLAVGCVLFIPFVHKFGRRPIYLMSIIIQLATGIWQAVLNTNGELMASNLVMCLGAAVSETIVQITIVDLFFINQYATMNGLFLLMQFGGAYLGPVAAGYIIDSQGWRWMWWWCSIFFGLLLVLFIFFFEETAYMPTDDGQLVRHATSSAASADKTDGDESTKQAPPIEAVAESQQSNRWEGTPKPLRKRLALFTPTPLSIGRHFYQPFLILVTFPAVAYTAITYGALLTWYTVITTASTQFLVEEPYNFSATSLGLLNLAPFVGTLLGTAIVSPLSDWLVVWLARKNRGIYEPEMRLWPAIPGAVLVSAGLGLFVFAMDEGKPWILLAVGWAMNSVGLIICGDISLSYLMDSYKQIVGDGIVAVIFVRNALSVVVLFCWVPWTDGMGYRGMYTLCTILSVVFGMVPVALMIWGKQARLWTGEKYRHYALRQSARRED